MKKLLCLSLAALVSTSSMGADWEDNGTNITGDKYYIDTSSIDNSGPYTRFWLKRISKKSKTSKPKDSKDSKDSKESIILYEMSCSSKQFRGISGIFYNFDGSIDRENSIRDWDYIIPDSIIDTVMQKVCN